MAEISNNQQAAFRIDTWFSDISKENLERLRVYNDDLLKFNKTLALISPKTVAYADVIHFADSILAARILMNSHPDIKEIYDFSSGGGFPGVIIATLYPSVKVICIENDDRKVEFIKHVSAQLLLKNLDCKKGSAETLPQNTVTNAIIRGAATISKSLLVSRKCMVKGGSLFHMKGDNWAGEVGEIPTQLCSVWAPSLVKEYRLPVGEFKFAVVKTEKIA